MVRGNAQWTTEQKSIEPQRSRVRRACEHDDDINVARIMGSPVTVHDFNLRPWAEIDARSRSQFAVTLDRDHSATGPDDLGKHGRIIARTGADLHHALIRLQIEVVEI